MPAHRKASIRELAAAAYELDSSVLEGELHRDPDSGEWMIGQTSLGSWLARYDNEKVVVIAVSLEDDRPMPTKVCRTCGTEHQGTHCPRCRRARLRLRGY